VPRRKREHRQLDRYQQPVHPYIYATYINDANAVMYRKRTGRPTTYDARMLAFLEQYPLTYKSVIEELTWYKGNILEQKDWSGVGPHTTGLVDVRTYGKSIVLVDRAYTQGCPFLQTLLWQCRDSSD
jgi:hypothetical protein